MSVTCLLRRGLTAIVLCLLAWPAAASASFTRLADVDPPGSASFFCFGAMTVTPASLDIVDCEHSGTIVRFSRDGQTSTGTIGPEISALPKITLGYMYGLAADPASGAHYVSDAENGRIVRLNTAGLGTAQIPGVSSDLVFSVPGPLGPGYCTDLGISECFPPQGSAPGEFSGPDALVADGETVLALDPGNTRVQRLSADLQSVRGIIGDATTLPNPTALAVDPVTGQVYVGNGETEGGGTGDIVIFSSSGAKLGAIPGGDWVGTLAVDPAARLLFATRAPTEGTAQLETYDLATRQLLRTAPLTGAYSVGYAALDPAARVLTMSAYTGNDYPEGRRYGYSPPPTCQSTSATIGTGATAAIAASCADADAPALTYLVAAPPQHGTLTGFDPATGTATYTPDPGFAGTDRVGLAARSLNGTSAPVDATVTVSAPAPPPGDVAAAQAPTCPSPALATAYERPLSGQLTCGSGTYTVATPPANGQVTLAADGTFTYTPNARFAGEDRFTYTVTTAAGTSVATTVTIRVGQALPAPEAKETANVQRATGTIKYRVGGKGPWITLVAGAQIPLGSEIDARDGRVGVFVIGANGQPQSADFFGGIFVLDQQGSPLSTWLALTGSGLPQASTRAVAGGPVASAAAKKKRKPKRRLWGDGKGDFRTAGNGSSASVRGTKWLVEDYADGTLTKVARGVVTVRDRCKKRTVTLRAGQQYFARLPKGRKRC